MKPAPGWFKPVAVVALLWNLLGCAAYLSDVTLTAEDVAKMSPAQQALYAARPSWAVAATALAVWGGALGSVGLILRKKWSTAALVVSLAGVIVQDVALFGLTDAGSQAGSVVLGLQGLVLVIALGLVVLARKAQRSGWLG